MPVISIICIVMGMIELDSKLCIMGVIVALWYVVKGKRYV
jgi:hypothetical protein